MELKQNAHTHFMLESEEDSKENRYLKKHVSLIHCENKFSFLQRKICNVLLMLALPQIEVRETHEVALRQLCNWVGYNSNDSKHIKSAIKGLISLVMEWNVLEKANKSKSSSEYKTVWNASALLAGATIDEGVVSYSYSPQMRQALSKLDLYGKINIFVQTKFSSAYSLILYENCSRFRNLKQTTWFSLDLFRLLMGVQKEKYKSFKELNRNVIAIAVNEINQKSDIFIVPKFKRIGATISEVQFILSENEGYNPTFKKLVRKNVDDLNDKDKLNLSESLNRTFGLSRKQTFEIIEKYDLNYLEEKIRLVNMKKNVEHTGAFLIAALKNDYQNKPDRKVDQETSSFDKEEKNKLNRLQESDLVSLQQDQMKSKLKAYKAAMDLLPASARATILENFVTSISAQKFLLQSYKKSGLKSPLVINAFLQYFEENYSDLAEG